MKFILVSNILENNDFINFLEDALAEHPDARFIVTGDLLNIFPETKEHLTKSMFYELYGRWVTDELEKLKKKTFRFFKNSPFTKALQEMFLPMGEYYQKAQAMALRRYEMFFSNIEAILGQNTMYFVPGDMDYPILAECISRRSNCFQSLDVKVVRLDGTIIGGVGGCPENLHPIHGIIDSTPNTMAVAEFKRKLNLMTDVDVLVTHISPEECQELKEFIRSSKVKLLICKSPYYCKSKENFPGKLEQTKLYNTLIIKVKPFTKVDHQAMIIETTNGKFDPGSVRTLNWSAATIAEHTF